MNTSGCSVNVWMAYQVSKNANNGSNSTRTHCNKCSKPYYFYGELKNNEIMVCECDEESEK